ncbi:putative CheY-like receiver and GGDEF domain-containing response regulator [Candidatus Terasakiella magnetica]|uniref:Putative CheY-like receiver and GGDEF domain-containing response regulator n=1 Tax=Candidatus Terasakiella magnetica TaxID=1867952 RepID=A0A1C3RC61_9PROT|nr:ATP-binding protein [Candidatus Terasakiella magnetica]SCA54860.1 putative CheY-like receiver and GGDEF domain-containing response regulator [Candidatus Terasakiella magnetica]
MDDLLTLVVSDNSDFHNQIVSSLDGETIKTRFVNSLDDCEPLLLEKENNISTIICDIPTELFDFERKLRVLKRKDHGKYIPIIGLVNETRDKSEIARQLFFHILPLPLHEHMLAHTIEAGKSDFRRYQSLLGEVSSRTSAIGLIKSGDFTLKTLQQAEALTTMLSLACPDPSAVSLGLSELLVNAIEHGNLEISYTEKSQLLETGKWDDEITKRLSDDKYKNRFVEVVFDRQEDHIDIVIRDHGNGFDWHKFIDSDPDKFTSKHGRGIAIAIAMGFNKLSYNEKGNQVTATITL